MHIDKKAITCRVLINFHLNFPKISNQMFHGDSNPKYNVFCSMICPDVDRVFTTKVAR